MVTSTWDRVQRTSTHLWIFFTHFWIFCTLYWLILKYTQRAPKLNFCLNFLTIPSETSLLSCPFSSTILTPPLPSLGWTSFVQSPLANHRSTFSANICSLVLFFWPNHTHLKANFGPSTVNVPRFAFDQIFCCLCCLC